MQRKKIRNKKVLLAANFSPLSDEVILHGLNLSKRMNSSLEILHLLEQEQGHSDAENTKNTILDLSPNEPVGYVPLINHRGLTTETVDYAKNRRNILCVVLCLEEERLPQDKELQQERFEEVTKLLNCPVVLYRHQ